MAKIWTPDRFQLKARDFLLKNLNSGLLAFPGFGKTSVVLSAIQRLRRQKKIKRVLVVAPIRPVYLVWPGEVKEWVQFEDLTTAILHGKNKAEVLNQDVDIHIINYDGLKWLAAQKSVKKGKWDLVVLDESGNAKHTTTNRSRALRSLRKKIPYCWILNGSPLPRSYLDLFGQFLAMDNGATFGTHIGAYKETYFRRSGWGMKKWVVTKVGKSRIKSRVAKSVFSIPQEEQFKLPPRIIRKVEVDLGPEMKAQYKRFLKECIMHTPEGKVTAVNAGVLTQKALQFTGGNIYISTEDEVKVASHLHSVKEQALVDLLEELNGNPALIGYLYKHELARLRSVLRPFEDPVPWLSDPDDLPLIQKWNRGELSCMLGYPRAMCHGLNLHKFPEGHGAIIFYSFNHNYEYFDQMVRRVLRRGFNRPVIVYMIIAKGTIDEAVFDCLMAREKEQDGFVDYIVKYWQEVDDDHS